MAEPLPTACAPDGDDDPVDRSPPLVADALDARAATACALGALSPHPGLGGWPVLVPGALLLGVGCGGLIAWWRGGPAVLGDNALVGAGCLAVNVQFWSSLGAGALLVSTLLALTEQRWRSAVNRLSEAIALAAIICALLCAVIALGRPERLLSLIPFPGAHGLLPNPGSPFGWNLGGLTALALMALLFWYWGLIPDLAALRERNADRWRGRAYRLLALGWHGSAQRWPAWQRNYLVAAALVTVLAVSALVMSSLVLVRTALPGWHSPLLPLHWVVSALAGALAATTATAVLVRRLLRLEPLITVHHLDRLVRLLLATSLVIAYDRGIAFYTAWYAGTYDQAIAFDSQAFGQYGWVYWSALVCSVVVPQSFWWRAARRRPLWIAVASVLASAGLWLDRWVAVVVPQQHGLVGARWNDFWPSVGDGALTLGGLGLFVVVVALLLRGAPVIAVADLRRDLAAAESADKTADSDAPETGGPA